jgi:glycyl-tRNA synthetase beta chain
MLDAVFAKRPHSPLDVMTRLAALQDFLLLPDATVLAAINKRIANILKKTQVNRDQVVDSAALTEDAERGLHQALLGLLTPVQQAARERRYSDSLRALVGLRVPVNDFFERVMVMDENIARRTNRLALLRDVQSLLGGVADLSRLPG